MSVRKVGLSGFGIALAAGLIFMGTPALAADPNAKCPIAEALDEQFTEDGDFLPDALPYVRKYVAKHEVVITFETTTDEQEALARKIAKSMSCSLKDRWGDEDSGRLGVYVDAIYVIWLENANAEKDAHDDAVREEARRLNEERETTEPTPSEDTPSNWHCGWSIKGGFNCGYRF